MEKVALAQLAQVVGPAERLVDPVQDFGILIEAMGRHLVLSGHVLKRFGWPASEHELSGDL
jgi:hypothetical protein